jgi:hypothetical protein
VRELEQLREHLGAAMVGADSPLAAADQLCRACVEMLEVDGASVSVVHEGATRGTFGSSGELSRRIDEFQFTFGEGPCLDAVRHGSPVLVADLDAATEQRWPAFREAVVNEGVNAVFALPVAVTTSYVGALDLFRQSRGQLAEEQISGGLHAARLAALPLMDLMAADVNWDSAARGDDGWDQLASLERVEVYQATGMIVAALDVDPVEAVVRLRANAYARAMTASEIAFAIVERRLSLDGPDWRAVGGGGSGL